MGNMCNIARQGARENEQSRGFNKKPQPGPMNEMPENEYNEFKSFEGSQGSSQSVPLVLQGKQSTISILINDDGVSGKSNILDQSKEVEPVLTESITSLHTKVQKVQEKENISNNKREYMPKLILKKQIYDCGDNTFDGMSSIHDSDDDKEDNIKEIQDLLKGVNANKNSDSADTVMKLAISSDAHNIHPKVEPVIKAMLDDSAQAREHDDDESTIIQRQGSNKRSLEPSKNSPNSIKQKNQIIKSDPNNNKIQEKKEEAKSKDDGTWSTGEIIFYSLGCFAILLLGCSKLYQTSEDLSMHN